MQLKFLSFKIISQSVKQFLAAIFVFKYLLYNAIWMFMKLITDAIFLWGMTIALFVLPLH